MTRNGRCRDLSRHWPIFYFLLFFIHTTASIPDLFWPLLFPNFFSASTFSFLFSFFPLPPLRPV